MKSLQDLINEAISLLGFYRLQNSIDIVIDGKIVATVERLPSDEVIVDFKL